MLAAVVYVVLHLLFFYAAWQLIIMRRFDVLVLLLVVSMVGMLPLFGIEQLAFNRAICLLGGASLATLTTLTGSAKSVRWMQLLLLVLFALVLIAFLRSTDASDATNRMMNFTFNYFLPLMFIPWRSDETSVRRVYRVWLVLAVFSSVLTILQTEGGIAYWPRSYTISKEPADRIFEGYLVGSEMYFSGFGFFENRSHNALFQAVALFFTLQLLFDGKLKRTLGYVIMTLLMIGILLSRSRAGVAFAVLGFLACIMLQWRRKSARQMGVVPVAVATLVLLIGAYWFSDQLFRPLLTRLEGSGLFESQNSLFETERFAMWAYFMADRGIMLSDLLRPFGIGFGSSPPDNVYLTAGLEVGLLGLIVFVVINGVCVVGAYKLYRRNREGTFRAELLTTFLALTMFVLHFFIGNLYFFEQIYIQVAPFLVYLVLSNSEAKTGSLK